MANSRRTNIGAVTAVAGRRIDAEGADPERFPLANVPLVRQQLKEQLSSEGTAILVCSAACGADLIALQAAEELGVRRRIVLPFKPERFRETSVADRPGDWGLAFDRLIKVARATGDLIVLQDDVLEAAAYAAANERIVVEAADCARKTRSKVRRVALVVWEGAPKETGDLTEEFRVLAIKAGFEWREIRTL